MLLCIHYSFLHIKITKTTKTYRVILLLNQSEYMIHNNIKHETLLRDLFNFKNDNNNDYNMESSASLQLSQNDNKLNEESASENQFLQSQSIQNNNKLNVQSEPSFIIKLLDWQNEFDVDLQKHGD